MVYAEGWPSTFHLLCQLSVHCVWTRILKSHLGLARFTVVSDIRPRGADSSSHWKSWPSVNRIFEDLAPGDGTVLALAISPSGVSILFPLPFYTTERVLPSLPSLSAPADYFQADLILARMG